jgi:hypothetical protein
MLTLLALAGLLTAAGDGDKDGLDDAWEQRMLERFAPRLILSQGECDAAPAEFAPGERDPRALARNGTLYGQVTPWRGEEGAWVEIRYFHLWANDCGRLAHPLDVERVSVLARAEQSGAPPEQWLGVYWFAAAHEGTVCDGSHGARADWLGAETAGAAVWVSRGKHASYLARSRCGKGCGGDVCRPQRHAMQLRQVINVGEPDEPLNGAEWTGSVRWPMKEKMSGDFSPAAVARLKEWDKAKAKSLHDGVVPLQSVVMGGERTLRGLETAGSQTGGALGTAREAAGISVKKGARAVGRALGVGKEESKK